MQKAGVKGALVITSKVSANDARQILEKKKMMPVMMMANLHQTLR